MTFEFVEAARLFQGVTLPQLGILVFLFTGMFTHIARHGQPRPKENSFVNGGLFLIEAFLLYWGGFFHTFSWPQMLWVFLAVLTVGVTCLMHGKVIAKHDGYVATFTILFVYMPILIAGGFFG